MDPLTWVVVICAAAVTLSRVVRPGTSRGLDTFAAGFLPYRDQSAGWPQGVQEEEPVAWSWSAGGKSDRPGPGFEDGIREAAEVVDIDSDDAPMAVAVGVPRPRARSRRPEDMKRPSG
jgi:hypothetical protein